MAAGVDFAQQSTREPHLHMQAPRSLSIMRWTHTAVGDLSDMLNVAVYVQKAESLVAAAWASPIQLQPSLTCSALQSAESAQQQSAYALARSSFGSHKSMPPQPMPVLNCPLRYTQALTCSMVACSCKLPLPLARPPRALCTASAAPGRPNASRASTNLKGASASALALSSW